MQSETPGRERRPACAWNLYRTTVPPDMVRPKLPCAPGASGGEHPRLPTIKSPSHHRFLMAQRRGRAKPPAPHAETTGFSGAVPQTALRAGYPIDSPFAAR